MDNLLYRKIKSELKKNGTVKTVTVISECSDFGKKAVVSVNSTGTNFIMGDDPDCFKDIMNEIDMKKGTCVTMAGGKEIFTEEISGKPKLIICGGGHIALPLSRLGKMLEFEVVVIDNRTEFTNRERFPYVDRVICGEFEEALDAENINSSTYIVIVTRGHKDDRRCLKKVIRSNSAYIGMIGSRSKVAFIFNDLKDEGYKEEELNRVHSPIGLKIGAQTPEEISISIFAEIIHVKNKNLSCSIEDDIMNAIECAKEDMVLATIVEKKGSSPRGIGAKMLVLKDGKYIGTVGGGSVENAVYEEARELIGMKKCHIETYDLSNSKAATLGMACGGTVRVFFEYIKADI